MEPLKLGEMEQKFADLIWERAPVASGQLVKLCAERFQWKRSTTYTMLGRLCARGLFANEKGAVSARIQKSDFHAMQGEQFLQEAFGGSLPRFLAAFTRRRKLSDQEADALQALIDAHREE